MVGMGALDLWMSCSTDSRDASTSFRHALCSVLDVSTGFEAMVGGRSAVDPECYSRLRGLRIHRRQLNESEVGLVL